MKWLCKWEHRNLSGASVGSPHLILRASGSHSLLCQWSTDCQRNPQNYLETRAVWLQSIRFIPSVCVCVLLCVCAFVCVCVAHRGGSPVQPAVPSNLQRNAYLDATCWRAEGVTSAPVCLSGSFNRWWRQPTSCCASMHHKGIRTFFFFLHTLWRFNSGESQYQSNCQVKRAG